jgi:predicted AAA+ superfamily ATPase
MHQTIQALIEAGIPPNRLWFLKLDHPLLMDYELNGWAKSLINCYGATHGNPLYLFLDEINYSPRWDRWLKTFHDERWPLRIVATSSSTAALRDRSVESGIGRWTDQHLMPYSFDEYLGLRGFPRYQISIEVDLFETLRSAAKSVVTDQSLVAARDIYLLVGGFPELLLAGDLDESLETAVIRSQQVLRSEAVQRVAGMDIPQVFEIKNPQVLERLVYILAGQMCGLMNVSGLAASLEMSRQTVNQYIGYLERAYLTFSLPNYSTSEETVQRKGRKTYFVDGAVRNAALQRGLAPIRDPRERGYLIENAAAAHLFAMSMQTGLRVYHWRRRGDEVDLIYDDTSGPIAFEISSAATHKLTGLRALHRRYPQFVGRSFLVSPDIRAPIMPDVDPSGIGRLSLDQFLIAVGRYTDHALARKLGIDWTPQPSTPP